MRYYTYINASEINLINWDWVYESEETVRWDNLNQYFIVSFNEQYIEDLERLSGISSLNHEDALVLMNTEQWTSGIDI